MSTCMCVCVSVSVWARGWRESRCPPRARVRVPLTQLEQPALTVRVEEGVREVVAVVLGDGEGLTLDAVEEVLARERREGKTGSEVHCSRGRTWGGWTCVASGLVLGLRANSSC